MGTDIPDMFQLIPDFTVLGIGMISLYLIIRLTVNILWYKHQEVGIIRIVYRSERSIPNSHTKHTVCLIYYIDLKQKFIPAKENSNIKRLF